MTTEIDQTAVDATQAEIAALGGGIARARRHPEPNAWVRRFPIFLMAISCLSVLLGGFNLTSDTTGGLDLIVSGVIIFCAAVSTRNYSLIAAILLLVFLVIDAGLNAAESGVTARTIRSSIYAALMAVTIWGLFQYRRALKAGGYKLDGNKWLRWFMLAPPALLIPFALLGVALMSTGIATRVVAGADMNPQHLEWMQANGMLEPGEEVRQFYSEGLLSIAEGGNMLTNRYLGVWSQENGETYSSWLAHADICSITREVVGNVLTDAVYLVSGPDEDEGFRLFLSVEDGGDVIFVDEANRLHREAIDRGAASGCETLDDEGISKTIAALMHQGFAGGVTVARDDGVLFNQGVGEMPGGSLSSHTTFRIGSLAEQFTSAALLDCGARRTFNLDAQIGDLWSGLETARARTTYRQLLTHSSGLPSSQAGSGARDSAGAVRSVLAVPLVSAPGAAYTQSAANHVLAAAALEQACGGKYHEIVGDLLERVDLKSTYSGAINANECLAPLPADDGGNRRWGRLDWCSTAFDLYRWVQAVFGGDILDDVQIAEMLRPSAGAGGKGVALGWIVEPTVAGEPRLLARSVDADGTSAVIARYPDQKLTVVVLSHAGDDEGGNDWASAVHTAIEQTLAL